MQLGDSKLETVRPQVTLDTGGCPAGSNSPRRGCTECFLFASGLAKLALAAELATATVCGDGPALTPTPTRQNP